MSSSDICPIGHVSINISGEVDGLFYGYVLSTALFGITIVQAWNYLNTNTDRWLMRSLVALLVAMDAAVTGVETQIVHHYLIEEFGNMNRYIIQSFNAEIMTTAVVVLIVELFFVVRIYKLNSQNWLVPATITILALGSFGSCTAYAVVHIHDDNFMILSKKDSVATISAFNGLAALADILITIALFWNLSPSRTGIPRTKSVIQKLLTYIINRGVLVTVTQTLTLIMYCVDQTNLHWMPTHLSTSKVYVITMLAILNARPALREQLNSVVIESLVFNSASTPSQGQFPVVRSRVANNVKVPDLGLKERTIEFPQAHDQSHEGKLEASGSESVATTLEES